VTLVVDPDVGPSGRESAPPVRRRRRWGRVALRLTALVLAALFLYVGTTFGQVYFASRRDEARPAQAIIVMGAAQYNGRPSAVLAARLDHAAELWDAGLAPIIVVTGGRRPGDAFTEAQASATYLERLGVPADAIEREVSSMNSWESLAASARFLHREGITDVLLVSDPYHAYRIKAIARELGLDAHVSPASDSPVKGTAELRAMARETVAVSIGRIIGYRRLVRLDDVRQRNSG